MNRQRGRRILAVSLIAAAVSAALSTLSLLLHAVLAWGGDQAGATTFRVIALIMACGAAASLITLVITLALLELFGE